MARVVRFALVALVVLGGLRPLAAAGKVTLDRLLREMTDLSLLAEFPAPPYVARQFSSYDRASQTPKDAGGWFANADRGFMLYDGRTSGRTPYFHEPPGAGRQPNGYFEANTPVGLAPTHKPAGDYVWAYATAPDGRAVDGKIPQGYVPRSSVRMDPQGHVLAEMDGPGCVTRIWSANPADAGRVRIYLDGAAEPVIEAPLEALLAGRWQVSGPGGRWTPFPDFIACERSRGYNLYFPIAYAKHCKITVEKPDIYYHVDYREYPRGTEVEPFRLDRIRTALVPVVRGLATAGPARPPAKGGPRAYTERAVDLKPGGQFGFAVPGGGAADAEAIDYLRFRLAGAGGKVLAYPEAVRGLSVSVRFDDADVPQVQGPLGDLFGIGPSISGYWALPLSVSLDGGLAWSWVMPYRHGARLEVSNHGRQTIHLAVDVHTRPYRFTDRSMYFHAKWRTETIPTRPFRDWTFCDLRGRGVFVGDALTVLNPVPAWWGEGDEKIYVDGETFPSWFGTGTEDYFGYAWCDPKPFMHPYHGQVRCDGPVNKGFTSLYRYHILDAIPFTRSFRFDMEVWHWVENLEVPYAATSYWYARTGASDAFRPPDPQTLRTIPSLPPPFRIPGIIEGESLRILGKSGNFEAGPQDMSGFADGRWSGDAQLWVRPAKVREWVDLAVPVPEDGRYRVVVYLTRARDYGKVRFSLDGKPIGGPVDGFEPNAVVSTGPIGLGEVDLKKGAGTLRVEVVGTNERSSGLRYMWGLDGIELRPVRR